MKAKLRTNSFGGLRRERAFLMFPSGHIVWLVTIRYGLGFAAARRAMMNYGLG